MLCNERRWADLVGAVPPVMQGNLCAWSRTVVLLSDGMTLPQPEGTTSLDALVGDMLERGLSEVRCPEEVSQQDFDDIRTVIEKVVRMYHPVERYVPWQPGIQRGNRGTLMDYLREGDYRGAHGFLAVEADFLPA